MVVNEKGDEKMDEEKVQQQAQQPCAADTPALVTIVGVRFKPDGKVYYFDPGSFSLNEGDRVVVQTARGAEYGFVSCANRAVRMCEVTAPLKSVVRIATEQDTQCYEENLQQREEALRVCQKKIAEHGLSMKLVDAEYTFDRSKLLFYFTADGRVDFRELVKDLASIFRIRIELRQIGIRDEAKLIGGLGICGRPLCCHSFLSDFVQVSIKMAKEQNLSLNSSKISGTCGRLMCCLRYEHDVYEEEIRKTPKMDSFVQTKEGQGIVTEVNPLAGLVRVRFIGSKSEMPPKLYHRDDVTPTGLSKKDLRNRETVQRTMESEEEPEDLLNEAEAVAKVAPETVQKGAESAQAPSSKHSARRGSNRKVHGKARGTKGSAKENGELK